MINPNAVSTVYGIVTELKRWPHKGDLSLKVRLIGGQELTELGFVYHKTLKVGDLVRCYVGFSIMSDRYGIKGLRKINQTTPPAGLVSLLAGAAYQRGYRFEYVERLNVFRINGAEVKKPANAFAQLTK